MRARLLRDAQETLQRTAGMMPEAPLLHRGLGAWLTEQPAPDEVRLRLALQPPPRSYEWVALAGMAETGAWPIDGSLIDDGLQWLSNVAFDRVGMPAPVTTDSIAHIGLALAIRRRPQFAQWLERVLNHIPARREPGWARSGASTILRRQDVGPVDPALRLALAALGVADAAPSDPDHVLDALVGSSLPSDPLHALVMLRAFELIQRSAESRQRRLKVFISYCRKDVYWLERLQTHLAPLERDGLIDRWDDTRISRLLKNAAVSSRSSQS